MYYIELTKGYKVVGNFPHTKFGPFDTTEDCNDFWNKHFFENTEIEGQINVICPPERL